MMRTGNISDVGNLLRRLGGVFSLLLDGMGTAVARILWAPLMLLTLLFALTPPGAVILALNIGRFRRRKAVALLGYLEQAVRLNLPLPQMLSAAAEAEKGNLRKALQSTSQHLAQGDSLGMALRAVAPWVPQRWVAMVSSAERIGRLEQTLAWLVRDQTRPAQPETFPRLAPLAYGAALGSFLVLALIFMGVSVAPKMEAIFRDFDTPLLPITQFVIEVSGSALPWFALALCLLGSYLCLVPVAMGRYRLPGPLKWVLDLLAWHTPFWHSAVRDQGLADTMRLLGQASRAGIAWPGALAEACQLKLNGFLRRRITAWMVHLESGIAPEEGARRAGMPELVVSLLATSQASGQTVEAMDFLARHYEARFSRTLLLAQGALVPAVEIGLGIPVAIFCLGFVMPLAALIHNAILETGLSP